MQPLLYRGRVWNYDCCLPWRSTTSSPPLSVGDGWGWKDRQPFSRLAQGLWHVQRCIVRGLHASLLRQRNSICESLQEFAWARTPVMFVSQAWTTSLSSHATCLLFQVSRKPLKMKGSLDAATRRGAPPPSTDKALVSWRVRRFG